jgi:uncharacterized protein YceH (UPF0502 family)
MLRGPQTPGELRSRADRLYSFDDLAAVQSTLERLAARTPNQVGTETGTETSSQTTTPLTTILPRQPGSREARYAHLLGDTPEPPSTAEPASPGRAETNTPTTQRLAQLEAQVATLSETLQALHTRLDRLESQAETPPPGSDSSVR